jgi:hypothetical protein
MESTTPVGSPGSLTRANTSRNCASMSLMVILPPQSCGERGSRSVQLGLYCALTHSEALGDRLDRLV